MHNLVSTLPHRLLREMAKKYGPLMHLQLAYSFHPCGFIPRNCQRVYENRRRQFCPKA
ncbi:unnamed protein product, partial [Vitis vinifera]